MAARPSFCPLISMHSMGAVLPLGHLGFLNLAVTVDGRSQVDWKDYHLEDHTWETATYIHVSHLPGKCHRTISISLSLVLSQEVSQIEEQKRGSRGMLREARGQQECHPWQTPSPWRHTPVRCLPQARWAPCWETKFLFKAVLLSAMVWCPGNWGARRYILMSGLTGKIQKEEMPAFGYQWKWENLKTIKRERNCVFVIVGLEWAEAGGVLYWISSGHSVFVNLEFQPPAPRKASNNEGTHWTQHV